MDNGWNKEIAPLHTKRYSSYSIHWYEQNMYIDCHSWLSQWISGIHIHHHFIHAEEMAIKIFAHSHCLAYSRCSECVMAYHCQRNEYLNKSFHKSRAYMKFKAKTNFDQQSFCISINLIGISSVDSPKKKLINFSIDLFRK